MQTLEKPQLESISCERWIVCSASASNANRYENRREKDTKRECRISLNEVSRNSNKLLSIYMGHKLKR